MHFSERNFERKLFGLEADTHTHTHKMIICPCVIFPRSRRRSTRSH